MRIFFINKRGTSLLEIIIAISLLGCVSISLTTLIIMSIASVTKSGAKLEDNTVVRLVRLHEFNRIKNKLKTDINLTPADLQQSEQSVEHIAALSTIYNSDEVNLLKNFRYETTCVIDSSGVVDLNAYNLVVYRLKSNGNKNEVGRMILRVYKDYQLPI